MNRNDRRVATAALAIAAIALTVVLLVGRYDPAAPFVAPADSTAVPADSMSAYAYGKSAQGYGKSAPRYATGQRKVETFPFDPNTADSTQLLRLGLQPWQVRNIYRYRSRGGVYQRKEDFAMTYGLTVKDYRRLEPYIRISPDYLPASTLVGRRTAPAADSIARRHKISPTEHVVLNTADTTELMRVPGIGAYFARAIVRHGRALGGYVSVTQLDEISDLPDDVKQYFVVSHPSPMQLNVNALSLSELKRHPYINYYQAKAIVDYRRLYGPIKSLDDLRLSRDFPPEVIERLRPYVAF